MNTEFNQIKDLQAVSSFLICCCPLVVASCNSKGDDTQGNFLSKLAGRFVAWVIFH